MNESTIKRSNCDVWLLSFQDKTYNLPSVFLIGVFEAVFFFFVASGLENEADVQPSQSSITCHLRLQLPIISAAFDGQDENRRSKMSL